MLHRIRLVSFDVLYTIIAPCLPIHVQYARVFEPYLGPLQTEAIRKSFRVAFMSVQAEQPTYNQGSQLWWTEVIKRTALGAGADEQALSSSLAQIVSRLMTRFSSKEAYEAYDDTLPSLRALADDLNVEVAVVSNADARIRSVLRDLDLAPLLNPIILSEEQGVSKPSPDIFLHLLSRVNSPLILDGQRPIEPYECVHVGDELDSDYRGAVAAGMQALLLHRAGSNTRPAHRETCDVTMDGIPIITDLYQVASWIRKYGR